MKQIINEQIIVPKITASVLPDRSLFGKKKEEEKDTGIRITAANWSEYLKVIQRVYTDSTNDLKSYNRGINYLMMLKDEFASRLDPGKESTLEVNTKYSQTLSYAEYRNGKLNVGEKVTGDNASERVLMTFRCANSKDLDQYLQKVAADMEKEEVVIRNMGLVNGSAIGWFGFQRYKDADESVMWKDENIFGWWGTDDFVITKLEGVLYLKEQ